MGNFFLKVKNEENSRQTVVKKEDIIEFDDIIYYQGLLPKCANFQYRYFTLIRMLKTVFI